MKFVYIIYPNLAHADNMYILYHSYGPKIKLVHA